VYQFFFKSAASSTFLLILSLFTIQPLFGQEQRVIDSLLLVAKGHQGIERFDAYYDIAFEYIVQGKFDEALGYLEHAQIVAHEVGDSLRIVKAGRVKSQMLRRVDRLNEAITELTSILPIAKRNKLLSEQKYILNGLAISYTFLAQYDKALSFHFEALVLRERDGNKEEIRESLNNIGLVYFKLKNFTKALEFYTHALQLDNTLVKSTFKDQLLINIALCHNQLKNFDDAQKLFSRALKYCEPNCSDQIIIAGEFGLGLSYFGQNLFKDAEKHFAASLYLSNKNGDKRYIAENQLLLGRIQIENKLLDSALIALTKAEEVAKNSGYNEVLIDVYKSIVHLFEIDHNYQQASFYQNKYITLKDSIYSETLIDNLAKVQTQYAERQNLATIDAKEEIIRRQRWLNISIGVISVLGAMLIFVLYRSNATKKKVNAALSEAKAIIEDQNRQLMTSNITLDRELKNKNVDLEKANESLRRVNDELDNFIYKTSHDIRGPLASLKGMCNVALMDVQDQVALGYLRKLDITAEKLNTILTRLLIVNQINNSTLRSDRIDFHSLITEVLLLEKKKGLPPRLVIHKQIDHNIEFYSDKEFIRIILENLVDNAIKFYNDSERVSPFVEISVMYDNDSIRIRVLDNGIGISQANPDKIFQMFSRASERSETGGIGLYITKTAVQKLGGTINLKTTPEGYTEFYVNLPLATQKVLA
jgi:signal transduction histidine kinase